jgi:hypothetical protein
LEPTEVKETLASLLLTSVLLFASTWDTAEALRL